jgi:hypothetical protein
MTSDFPDPPPSVGKLQIMTGKPKSGGVLVALRVNRPRTGAGNARTFLGAFYTMKRTAWSGAIDLPFA